MGQAVEARRLENITGRKWGMPLKILQGKPEKRARNLPMQQNRSEAWQIAGVYEIEQWFHMPFPLALIKIC